MPKNIEEAVKLKIEDINENSLDLDDVLDVKKITKKSYSSSYEKVSFELLLACSPNIWVKIDENKTEIFGTWGGEDYRKEIEVAGLYDELLEIFQ